jgi:hypothetical protein
MNELLATAATGSTLYVLLLNATGQVYNGSTFETPANANWSTYDVAMTEAGTTGIYRASMPTVAEGAYSWLVYHQSGASPAVGDAVIGSGAIRWTGTAEETVSPSAQEIADAILLRDWEEVTGTVPDRSTLNALRFLRNKWVASGGTLTVYEEDDATPAWEAALTTNLGADRITGVTPE